MKDKRFEIVYSQGVTEMYRILRDTFTGVLYLQTVSGYAGGLTPLLDKDGKPTVWSSEMDW